MNGSTLQRIVALVSAGHRLGVGVCALLMILSPAFGDPIVVTSPNGGVKAEISVVGGMLRYSVSLDGEPLLGPATVVMQSDGALFGKEGSIGVPEIREVNETYPFLGKIAGRQSRRESRRYRSRQTVRNTASICTLPTTASASGCGYPQSPVVKWKPTPPPGSFPAIRSSGRLNTILDTSKPIELPRSESLARKVTGFR